MIEPMSQDEFEHFHKDGMLHLEKEKLTLVSMKTPAWSRSIRAWTQRLEHMLSKHSPLRPDCT